MKDAERSRCEMSVNWTSQRPTEPGEYWLSIAPSMRAKCQALPVAKVKMSRMNGVIMFQSAVGTTWAQYSDPVFDGAQWARIETPADPHDQTARQI